MNSKWTELDKQNLKVWSQSNTDDQLFVLFGGRFTKDAITKQRQRMLVKKSKNGRPPAATKKRNDKLNK